MRSYCEIVPRDYPQPRRTRLLFCGLIPHARLVVQVAIHEKLKLAGGSHAHNFGEDKKLTPQN